jgi:hypothetical protein
VLLQVLVHRRLVCLLQDVSAMWVVGGVVVVMVVVMMMVVEEVVEKVVKMEVEEVEVLVQRRLLVDSVRMVAARLCSGQSQRQHLHQLVQELVALPQMLLATVKFEQQKRCCPIRLRRHVRAAVAMSCQRHQHVRRRHHQSMCGT